MSAGLAGFEIRLDRPNHTFSPGEILAGRVLVELNRPKTIRCLKIRIKGAAKVKWTETNTSVIDWEKTRTYLAEELYFKEDVYALGSPDVERVNIQAGSHVFPFQFILPLNIPSSFKTTHGKVKYSVKAIMERPWKFDHEAAADFDVLTSYVLTEATELGTVVYHERHDIFSLFKKGGKIEFSVCIHNKGVEIGEYIEATVNINNTSGVNVTRVKLQLEQTIRHHARLPYNKVETLTEKLTAFRAVREFAKQEEVFLRLEVPTLPHSGFPYCSIINIDYFAIIMICLSGANCPVTRKYPVKIGIKPVAGVEYEGNPAASINAPTFEAPFLPPDEFRTNAGDIYLPGPSSNVPPSYNDATQLDGKEKF